MNAGRVCLWGGVLFSAGIAGAAPQFILQDSYDIGEGILLPSASEVLAGWHLGDANDDHGVDAFDDAYADLGENLNLSVTSFGGTTSSTIVNQSLIRFEARWDGSYGDAGYFGGEIRQFFQVSEDTTLRLSWDMSNTDFYGPPHFFLFDSREETFPPFSYYSIEEHNAVGYIDVQLVAGVQYAIMIDAGEPYVYDTGMKFIEAAIIPAPGALGVLGAAGAFAARRRRPA